MHMPLPEAGGASNLQRSGASTGTSATSGPRTRAHSSYHTQTTPAVPAAHYANSHSYSHSMAQQAGSTSSSSSIHTSSPQHSFSATAGPAPRTAYSHSPSTHSRPVRHSRMPSRELPPPLPSSSWWQRFTGPSQVSQTAVACLMSAGFARAPARRALARTAGDIGAAMKLLQTEGDGVDNETDKTKAKSSKGKDKDKDQVKVKSATLPQLQKRKSQRWSSSALKRNATILSKPPRRESSLDDEPLPAPRREAFEHVRRPGLEPIPEPWVLLEPELEAGLETQFESEHDAASRHLVSPERVHRLDPPKLELAVVPRQPVFYSEPDSEAPPIDDWDSESCSSYCSTDTFGVRGSGSGSASVVATTIGTPTSSAGCQQDKYRVHQRYASGVEVWVVEVAKWPGSDEGAGDTTCSGTTTAAAWTARTGGNGLSGRSNRSNRSEHSTKAPGSTMPGSTTTWPTRVTSSATAFTSATALVTGTTRTTATTTKPSTAASTWLGERPGPRPGYDDYEAQLYTDEREDDEKDNDQDNHMFEPCNDVLYW